LPTETTVASAFPALEKKQFNLPARAHALKMHDPAHFDYVSVRLNSSTSHAGQAQLRMDPALHTRVARVLG
jgi:hypothetical protein